MNRICAGLGVVVCLWTSFGCSHSTSPASLAVPTAPTAPTPALSGLVSQATGAGGTSPVEGVLVEEATSGQSAITDGKGIFSIAPVPGRLSISVSKPGYFTDTANFPPGATFLSLQISPIPPTYTLSGVAIEVTTGGTVPVEGVLIEAAICNPRCRVQSASTDASGFYRLSSYAGPNAVWVTKEGYDVDGMPPVPSCDNCNALVTLDGDTRLDLRLVRR